ncbi:MAG: hypothetical protein AB8B88_13590 [Devosiaceae bacterium]
MTLHINGVDETTQNASSSAEHIVKTFLDCDILTVARDARAREQGARRKAGTAHDPLDALYKPLGNKDVASVLQATGHAG